MWEELNPEQCTLDQNRTGILRWKDECPQPLDDKSNFKILSTVSGSNRIYFYLEGRCTTIYAYNASDKALEGTLS